MKQAAFLKAVSRTPHITRAAEIAKIHHESHYRWLRGDPDYPAAFAAAWEKGVALREKRVERRALEATAGVAA